MKHAKAVYRALLYGYPAPFRQEYGRQMCLMFFEQLADARRTRAWRREATLWVEAARDLFTIAPREHWHVIALDLRYAFRTMVINPAFTSVAILSLALGIGATTSIFSLWNGVLHAPLPGVHNPASLVMLSDPNASGAWRGRWNGRTDGPRPWLSYAEFEQLRNYSPAFSAIMASQSSLSTWQVGVDGGPPQEARGRLVSGGYFDVLGVRPTIGRLFTTADEVGEPAHAVIGHAYWQRRFGGRPDTLGRTLRVRNTPVTIVGVTAAGFIGETSGQQPDFWLPLRLQPRVLPGSDWLHEQPPDKMMWLHVFGRLTPGVTNAEAEAQANAVFRAGLESFYGTMTTERSREFLDQQLRISAGARGASVSRREFSSSLSMLLASVGVLLLIACANLANLLLARGAARQTEVAVRVSLGASRARLVRQLITESLTLAAIGGITGVVVASLMHGALVQLLQQAEPGFFIGFRFTVPVLAFGLGVTLAAALVFGALPAWQVTRTAPNLRLKDTSRGTIGSRRELRSGRWLVGVQLALSLPLLVGAGLLVRTVYNLQRSDLGFDANRLVLATVDLSDVMHDSARRDRVLRELRERIQRIADVESASFSQISPFSGGMSTATIEVEGSALTANGGVDSGLDRVGADYFTTLRVPLRRGRDISEDDRAGTRKVCVVNEAFVKRHFGEREPIGMRVTTIDDDNVRTTYEIVGVVADARTQSVQSEVAPRFFVPAEQRPSLGTSRTFLIRTVSDTAGVITATREATKAVDEALSITDLTPIERRLELWTAEQRIVARLAIGFGAVALTLAAIGLYGVLTYGTARRASEIAIRIALGARALRIIAMILRETAALIVAGLFVGGVLAYVGSQMIASRLYGVAPDDAFTLTLATAVLLFVALIAAYLPARRASQVDPMAVLHQS